MQSGACRVSKRIFPEGCNHGGKDTAEQAKLRSKVIIKMTTQEKPKDGTHWSTRGLAKVLWINHSFVPPESGPEVRQD